MKNEKQLQDEINKLAPTIKDIQKEFDEARERLHHELDKKSRLQADMRALHKDNFEYLLNDINAYVELNDYLINLCNHEYYIVNSGYNQFTMQQAIQLDLEESKNFEKIQEFIENNISYFKPCDSFVRFGLMRDDCNEEEVTSLYISPDLKSFRVESFRYHRKREVARFRSFSDVFVFLQKHCGYKSN